MTVVALTGGIAAGKTTVTAVLRANGIVVVDADDLARQAVEPGSPGLTDVVRRFGTDVLNQDDSLNREELATRVFGDDQARSDLNAIVHPEVWRLSHHAFEEHEKNFPNVPLVYAIPLLAESGRIEEFDAIIVVDAPAKQRVERLVASRQMSSEEAHRRVAAQVSDDTRRAIADIVLDSSVSAQQTQAAAEELATALWAAWPDNLDSLPTRF